MKKIILFIIFICIGYQGFSQCSKKGTFFAFINYERHDGSIVVSEVKYQKVDRWSYGETYKYPSLRVRAKFTNEHGSVSNWDYVHRQTKYSFWSTYSKYDYWDDWNSYSLEWEGEIVGSYFYVHHDARKPEIDNSFIFDVIMSDSYENLQKAFLAYKGNRSAKIAFAWEFIDGKDPWKGNIEPASLDCLCNTPDGNICEGGGLPPEDCNTQPTIAVKN